MAYTVINFKTKKALREAIALEDIMVYQPGPFGRRVQGDHVTLEGPHYPQAHSWYANAPLAHNAMNGFDYIPKGSKIS